MKFPSSFYNGAQLFLKCVKGHKAQKFDEIFDEDYYFKALHWFMGTNTGRHDQHSLLSSYQHVNNGNISSNMSKRGVASGKGGGVDSPGYQSQRDSKSGDKMDILNKKSDFLRSKHSRFLS